MPDYMRNTGMNPGHETHEQKSIEEIMECIDRIMVWHKIFNNKAMKACQAMGYNGFKRLHRYNARCFLNWHMKLENEAFDKFRFILDLDTDGIKFSIPMDLTEHLKRWDDKLGHDIEELAMYNNEYRMMAGKGNCAAEKALHKMTKNHEKAGRWYKRFMETKSAHDMHDLDDHIHKKYKAKEKRKQMYQH